MPGSLYISGSAIAMLLRSLPVAIEIPVYIGVGVLCVGLTVVLVRFLRPEREQIHS